MTPRPGTRAHPHRPTAQASRAGLERPGSDERCEWRLLAALLVLPALLVAAPAAAQTTNAFLVAVPAPVAPGGKLAYVATVINDSTVSKDYDLDLGYDPSLVFLGAVAKEGSSSLPACAACTADGDCLAGGCRDSGICNLSPAPCVLDRSSGAGARWTLGNLGAGKAVSLHLEHQVSAAAPLTDPETQMPQLVSTLEAAEHLAGGSLGTPAVAQARTGVFADAGAAPLFVTFDDTPLEVHPGADLVYRLIVINRGAFDRDVDVFLDYDPNLAFIDFQTDDDVCVLLLPGVTCVLPTLAEADRDFFARIAPGGTVTLRLRLQVDAGTTRSEVSSGVRLIDQSTGRGVEDDEATDVLVCDGVANGSACDNGDVCPGDACSGGSCVAAACPEACDGAPDGAPCADANACTVEECQGGQCVAKLSPIGGTPVEIRCNACESCDPALACQLVSAAEQKVCRSAFGSCDAAEVCDGVDSMCPADVFQPAGAACDDGNASTVEDQCLPQPDGFPRCVGSPDPCGNSVIDPGEECDDGNQLAGDCCSPACAYEPAGTPCLDADVCNGGESCDGAGACQAGTPIVCDPATTCVTSGICDPVEGCVFDPDPAAGCHTGFVEASLLVTEVRQGFERLKLELGEGPTLALSEFGDPTVGGGASYTVCIYRKDDGAFAGDLHLDRAGQSCGAKPCWQASPLGKGFRYDDRSYSADGIGSFQLARSAGHSRITVLGRNNARKGQASLPAGTTPPGIAKGLDRSFAGARVQVRRDDGGACFEADLGTVIRSGPTYFRAKN